MLEIVIVAIKHTFLKRFYKFCEWKYFNKKVLKLFVLTILNMCNFTLYRLFIRFCKDVLNKLFIKCQ